MQLFLKFNKNQQEGGDLISMNIQSSFLNKTGVRSPGHFFNFYRLCLNLVSSLIITY